MAEVSPKPPVLGGAIRVGRYFQLVSIVPALVVVLPAACLVAGGSLSSEGPSIARFSDALSSVGIGESLLLVSATITLGMLLQPMQFASTQFLEGYWGTSQVGVGRAAAKSRVAIHAHRRWNATLDAMDAADDLAAARASPPGGDGPDLGVMFANIEYREFGAMRDSYPAVENVLPTRLGNTLRRFEDSCGAPYGYGVEGPAVVPHLIHLAGGSAVGHVDDARLELDLAVRFVVSWCLSAVVLSALLWQHPLWLVCPAAAYGLAWVSYRGACHVAEEYGHAVWVLFDLHHQRLAREVHLPPYRTGDGTPQARLVAAVRRSENTRQP